MPLEIFVILTERVDAGTAYVAMSSPRISTCFDVPLLESKSKVTLISLPENTRFGARPLVASVNASRLGTDVLQIKSLFPCTCV